MRTLYYTPVFNFLADFLLSMEINFTYRSYSRQLSFCYRFDYFGVNLSWFLWFFKTIINTGCLIKNGGCSVMATPWNLIWPHSPVLITSNKFYSVINVGCTILEDQNEKPSLNRLGWNLLMFVIKTNKQTCNLTIKQI